MLQFRIVHCIQDVGKQVLDEEERGITKQLRILDQGNCIAFAIIGDFGRNVDSPFGLLGVDIRQEYIFRIAFLRPLVDYFEYLVLAHVFHMDCVAIAYFPVSHRGTLVDFAFMPLCRCQRREHDQ